jgi:hypothetical protein
MTSIPAEERIQNLESSYSRVAESMGRFADGIKDVGDTLKKLNIFLMGRMDEEAGKMVPGYFARVDALEACLAKQKRSWKSVFGTIKEVGVTIATVFIIWKLGIKG